MTPPEQRLNLRVNKTTCCPKGIRKKNLRTNRTFAFQIHGQMLKNLLELFFANSSKHKKMTKQINLIGNHPNEEHPLGAWLNANDIPVTDTKCHRELTERNDEENDDLILWMANKLISHHYTNFRLEQLKKKYTELGFEKYAK